MFSIQNIKQERLMKHDNASSGFIAHNISKKITITVGVDSSDLNSTILLYDKIISNSFTSKYPDISFSNVMLNTNRKNIKSFYIVESKTLEFEIFGTNKDINSFFSNELKYLNPKFY